MANLHLLRHRKRLSSQYLQLANRLADAARAAIMPRFGKQCHYRIKEDGSPVTDADLASEEAMCALLEREAPDHAVWSEESGRRQGDWLWILDPIDGTRSFASGCPLFTVLIGLVHKGEPVLGVIDAPATGERWAGDGSSCIYTSAAGVSDRCRVRPSVPLAEAIAATTLPPDDAAGRKIAAVPAIFRYGGDAYNFAAVASGRMHFAFDCNLQPYDYMPLIPVIEGAGGRVAELSGRRPSIDGDGSFIAAADDGMLKEILALAADG